MKRKKANVKRTIQKKIEISGQQRSHKPRQSNQKPTKSERPVKKTIEVGVNNTTTIKNGSRPKPIIKKRESVEIKEQNVGLPRPKPKAEAVKSGADRMQQRIAVSKTPMIKTDQPLRVELVNDRDYLRFHGKQRPPKEIPEIFKKPYVKKEFVDFDAIIIISSYERYDKLISIIEQLMTQKTNYSFKIIVLNDGSVDKRYGQISNMFNDVYYVSNEVNNGKIHYWKSINTLLEIVSNYRSQVIIQIDDDFVLCEGFLNRLLDLFFKLKEEDNKYVAIYYHNPDVPIGTPRWGLNMWLDGGALYDAFFWEELNYKINAVSSLRWGGSSANMSSGVWRQVSGIINSFGCKIYRSENSYAKHGGNDLSMMNTELREKIPIFTKKFIDDE